MYNSIKYCDIYSGTTGGLQKYHKVEPGDLITDSSSFKSKWIMMMVWQTNNDGIINAEIAWSLKYLSNFWRTLEIPLINCKINLTLIQSANCVTAKVNKVIFTIIDVKLYVPAATLSNEDNAKLLQLLQSVFKPIRGGLFWDCSQMGQGQKAPLHNICCIYPTMMKLVIPYLKNILKLYKSYESPLEYCWHQQFFTRNWHFLLDQEI